jgi:hypothetical protein
LWALRALCAFLLFSASAFAQSNTPSIAYLYPSGNDAPLNSIVMVGVSCCGAQKLTVSTSGLGVAGRYSSYQMRDGTTAFLFTPAAPLLPQAGYVVTIGLYNGAPLTATFKTGTSTDTAPPTVVSTHPADGQDYASATPSVTIRFSKPMDPSSLPDTAPLFTNIATAGGVYSNWIFQNPTTLTLDTYGYGLPQGAVYRLRFGSKLLHDLAGNTLSGPLPDIVFTTYPDAPKDGPQLKGSAPAEGEASVPTNSALFLQFDRAVVLPDAASLTLSAAGDPSVALKVADGPRAGGIIVRPQNLLRSNQDYTLQIAQVNDLYGGHTSGLTLHFRTGLLPETRTFNQTSAPASVVPNVSVLRWTFNRAINPFVMPQLGQVDGVRVNGAIPAAPAHLLCDGVTIEANVPGPGVYILAGQILDRVGENLFPIPGTGGITVQAVTDTQAPSPLALFPAPGSAAIAAVNPGAVFDETLDQSTSLQTTLSRGGTAVAADVSIIGPTLLIRPRLPLPDGDYQVEIHARDAAGNSGDPVVWTFHVPADLPADKFAVVSSDPADRSLNVDTHASISVTFNRPPNPVLLLGSTNSFGGAAVNSSLGAVNGHWRFDGNSAIFDPDPAFPPGVRVSWGMTVSDFAGNRVAAAGGFWTAAGSPSDPFRVVSTSTVSQPNSQGATVYLQFNQPASPASVNSRTIQAAAASIFGIQVFYDAAGRRAAVSNLNGPAHIVAGPGVLSQAGAPLETFAADFDSRGLPLSFNPSYAIGPFLRNPQDFPLPAGSPLVVYFTQAMPRDLVERGLRVYTGDTVIAGRLDWTPDSSALTFVPSTPLANSLGGVIILSMVPFGGTGVEMLRWSTEAAPPAARSPRWSLADVFAAVPNDAVIDVEFDTAPPAGYIVSATAAGGNNGSIKVPLEVQALSPKRFRFRPAQPFTSGVSFEVIAKTTGADLLSPFFAVASFATPTSRKVFTGPMMAAGPVPLNSLIWIESQTPLSTLSLNAALTLDGQPAKFTTEITDQGFLVRLHPVGLLRGNSTYTVALTGLQDMAGRALPDRTWSFQTGAGPDFSGAHIVSFTPMGVAPASSTPRVVFDKPVHLARHSSGPNTIVPTDFIIQTASANIPGNIDYSDDGRTLSYIPARPWPPATEIALNINSFQYSDWTGAPLGDSMAGPGVPRFTTASPPALPRPVIDAVNPYRDAPDVPLNVRIQARFAEPVDIGAASIQLARDGAPVAARVSLAADGRTITIAPGAILQAGAAYTVTIDGVLNGAGVTQDGPASWSFRTVNALEAGASVSVVRIAGNPVSFRLDSPVPLNPASIDASSFDLRGYSIIAVSVQVDPQARSVILTPLGPIPAGNCQLAWRNVTDWAGNNIVGSSSFTMCGSTNRSDPPRVNVLPPDGGTIAWNDVAIVIADEPFVLRYGAAGIRMTSNGATVPVNVQRTGPLSMFTLQPAGDWIPGQTYQVEMRGITDNDANEAPPVNWSFTVAGDAAPDSVSLKLLSTTPAQNAVGVPPDSPVSFDFSKPVAPTDQYGYGPSEVAILKSAQINLTGQLKVDFQGAHVQFASGPLPAGAQINATLPARDLSGLRNNYSLFFYTAASADTTPPTVESISPPAGSRVGAGQQDFVVRFSKPVMIVGSAAQFAGGGQTTNAVQGAYPLPGDGRTMIFTIELPAAVTGTLNLLSGIVDLAGNALAPVSIEYTTGPAVESGFRVISITPSDGAAGVDPATPIAIRFSQPATADGLAPYLRVWNDGAMIPVTLSSDPDGRTRRAVPPSPWLAGTAVSVQIGALAYSATGVLLQSAAVARFAIAGAAPNDTTTNEVAAIESTASAVDVLFVEPRLRAPGEPFGIRVGQRRVSARIDRMGGAWFRIVPDEPLDPARHYVLMAGPGVEFPLRVADAAPAAASGSGELRPPAKVDEQGRIRIRLEGADMLLRFRAESVGLVDGNGQAVPADARISADGHELSIAPHRHAESYRVVLR